MSINSINKKFAKYVSQNVFGMIGISMYILADTFFIARAEGTNGITALNLVLPFYNLVVAIGAMIGVGSAIRFKILRASGRKEAEQYFSNAILFGVVIGVAFMVLGATGAEEIVRLLGGDSTIVQVGAPYIRIYLLFAPFAICNYILNAFVRNDGAPTIAMAATLASSMFNILMDYILMFPLDMGMAGAALATSLAPMVGMAVCGVHFLSKSNTVQFLRQPPSLRRLLQSCQLGVSAFIGEFASGVTTVVFNMLILGLAGNIGVAAYGVIANTSLIAIAVFNGVSQGVQPLFSEYYGKGEKHAVHKALHMGMVTALVLAVLMVMVSRMAADSITALFNSANDPQMAEYAADGLRLYFLGFLFAGVNIVGTGYLSAVKEAKWAFIASILRGFVAIILCAVILANLIGLKGVWLAFPAAEGITMLVTILAIRLSKK